MISGDVVDLAFAVDHRLPLEGVIVRLERLAIGSTIHDGRWVRWYSPDDDSGIGAGRVISTANPLEAMVWPTTRAALDGLEAQSTQRPFRADGQPNRPLTAWVWSMHWIVFLRSGVVFGRMEP